MMHRSLFVLLVAPVVACSAQHSSAVPATRSAPPVAMASSGPLSLEDSLLAIPSSRDRMRALLQLGATSDRAMLAMVLRVARSIPNTTDKSRLLTTLAPRYLSDSSVTLVASFFRVARTIQSSEEKRDFLIDVTPYAAKSAGIANAVIENAREVPSSPDRADVLAALAEAGAIRRDDVKENFTDALQEIPGKRDRERVERVVARVARR